MAATVQKLALLVAMCSILVVGAVALKTQVMSSEKDKPETELLPRKIEVKNGDCSPTGIFTSSHFQCDKHTDPPKEKLEEHFKCLKDVGGSNNTADSDYKFSTAWEKITSSNLDMCRGNYSEACVGKNLLEGVNVERKEDACRLVSYSYARAYQGRTDSNNVEPINNETIRVEFLRKSIELYENAKNITNPNNDPGHLIPQAKANIGYIYLCLLHENTEMAKKYLMEAEAAKDPDAGPWLRHNCVGNPKRR